MIDVPPDEAIAAELERTRQLVQSLAEEIESIVMASLDDNADDEHDPEGPTIAFERARLLALRTDAIGHLTALEQATSRVGEGRYGLCKLCRRPISQERLEALPTTEVCIECASQRKARL